jgi:AcrR family transcriptional regulator
MSRTYTLKKRAEQQAETRQRIVETAVDLHSSIGPAATTISMIADKAGVQRHTVYAHFPDDRSLFMACSGMAQDRDPMPGADAWRDIADRHERLTTGLSAIYAWYERNAQLLACVLRDAEHHTLTRETAELRFGATIAGWHDVLGHKFNAKERAMLHLALGYFTWRSLVREAGLKSNAAVGAMVRAIENAGGA